LNKDIKEKLITNNNKLYQKAIFVDDFYTVVAVVFESVLSRLNETERQLFFDTMGTVGIEIFEKYLGITSPIGASIEERRNNIKANWLATRGKKFTLKMIEEICLAWDRGRVDVSFTSGKIKIAFLEIYGVPSFIENLKKTIEKIKPAHLPYEFIYQLHTWGDVKTHTWEFFKTHNWEYVKSGDWTNG
jgi:hypothetical protein